MNHEETGSAEKAEIPAETHETMSIADVRAAYYPEVFEWVQSINDGENIGHRLARELKPFAE